MARLANLDALRTITPEMAGQAVYRSRKQLRVHAHTKPIDTIRKATHRGHAIVIKTTYDIRIDGRRITGHLELGNDGRLHYHGLPNYGWNSAVDMCKQLIDSFPDDFPARGKKPPKRSPEHGSHEHHHGGGGH